MIGIFGGTFNPIHLGHLIIAEEVREKCCLSKIIFIPTFRPPHKDSTQLLEAQHRLNMVKLAIASNPYFECSDIELLKAGISYTIETLHLLLASHPAENYALIIGGDSLLELHTWERVEELLTRCDIIVTTRPGFITGEGKLETVLTNLSQSLNNKKLLAKIKFYPTSLIDISSTMIRERSRLKKSIRYLVPDIVIDYLKEHQLYEAI